MCVNVACNSGLELVSGDFVLFSAADDCLSPEMVERASAAAAGHPGTGIVFSDQAEMSPDGDTTRLIPLALPEVRRYFSGGDFVRLMQQNFFYFHVSSVWFNVELLRALGGFRPDLVSPYPSSWRAHETAASVDIRMSPRSWATRSGPAL